jgi:hypothetical protein
MGFRKGTQMTNTIRLSLISSSFVLLTSTVAVADHARDGGSARNAAPISGALEIAVGGNYTQGAGDLGGGMASMQDVSGPGGGIELQLGYRVTPHLALGVYAAAAAYEQGSGVSDVGSASAGLRADWHFRPDRATDPWLSIGTGVRALGMTGSDGVDRGLRGVDLARVQVGVDYRLSDSVSIAPVFGVTATMYGEEKDDMDDRFREIADKDVNYSFTGGVLGRFDLFGRRGR